MKANWANRTLFHGDNLGFMRAMNGASVDLIATDPPFNKGRDFHAAPGGPAKGAGFQDRWSWARDVRQEWVDQLQDDHPQVMRVIESARRTHSDGMGAFMCFLAARLLEMRRLLKPAGGIFLHCDPTGSHYIKACMDAVFGSRNFRGELVWFYPDTPGRTTKDFPRKHDAILAYAKSQSFLFNQDGSLPGSVLQIAAVKGNSKERTGYPTQKPLALYECIIEAASAPGDMVLDPFAGCATTCVAAERLRRQWTGIDIWPKAAHVARKRVEAECRSLLDGAVVFTTAKPLRAGAGAGPQTSRAEMINKLLARHGNVCHGCGRVFGHPDYLQLEHDTPRSEGGSNHISNRILLCEPCRDRKSKALTLAELRKSNAEGGVVAS